MASCFRGAFPPVDLRAVCLVRATCRMQKVCVGVCIGEVHIYPWVECKCKGIREGGEIEK